VGVVVVGVGVVVVGGLVVVGVGVGGVGGLVVVVPQADEGQE